MLDDKTKRVLQNKIARAEQKAFDRYSAANEGALSEAYANGYKAGESDALRRVNNEIEAEAEKAIVEMEAEIAAAQAKRKEAK